MELPSVVEIEMLLGEVDQYLPLVKKVTDKLAPVLDELAERISKYNRQSNVDAFKFYVDSGFTRSEALLLVINANAAMEKAMQNINKK